MKTNNPIKNPTWNGDIRNMFKDSDIACMKSHGLDLSDYATVKDKSDKIYDQLLAGNMPPGSPWSKDSVETFYNWMINDCPEDTNSMSESKLSEMKNLASNSSKASRIRKEISTLTSAEVTKLKAAFNGIMKLDVSDPNSYFVQAGWHGFPKSYCMHHVDRFNPWHRAYLLSFENALRSIAGCEDVTLPYWDFTTPLPDIFNQAPFANYTLPVDIGASYNKGYVTTRYTARKIQDNFKKYDVLGDFDRASTKTDWEDYHGLIASRQNNTTIAGHDGGHVSIGETMSIQDVSAFDPIFWFYHCNLDKLFWEWQKKMQATDLNSLLSKIETVDSRNIFTDPILKRLKPFTESPPRLNTLDIIDSKNSLDVDYENNKQTNLTNMLTKTKGSTLASNKFFVHTALVNVRVKGINRLKIPGSFKVHLLKDEKIIASKAFFQPNEVEKCENCVENPMAHFDFELPLKDVSKGKLSVWVEPLDHSLFGDHFPHNMMGNPTVNVRLLVSNE